MKTSVAALRNRWPIVSLALLAATLIAVAVGRPVSAKQPALEPVPLQVDARFRRGTFSEPRQLWVPPGFQVNLFAMDLGPARFMAVGPAGDVYVTTRENGTVVRLRDLDADGVADESRVYVEGLDHPHGIAIRDDWVFIAETGRVIRVKDDDGDGRADRSEVVVADLPAGGGHFTRTIGFGPDDGIYVSVGSSCNVCREADDRRAAISRFNPDGSSGRIFASGLRNAVGFVWHSTSGEIWATDNGRDLLGDDYPPEEMNLVRDGQHYGWPHCHGSREPDPQFGDPDFCETTTPPVFSMQAHSAPLGLAFYTAQQFPSEYRGDLFVAFHGSWNRSVPTGYKVVRIRMADGQPVAIEDFLDGFHDGRGTWGRPVQPVVAADGAMLVSDDHAGAIYRVTHRGP